MGRCVTISALDNNIPIILTRSERHTTTVEGVCRRCEQALVKNASYHVTCRDKNLNATVVVRDLRSTNSIGGKWIAIIDVNSQQIICLIHVENVASTMEADIAATPSMRIFIIEDGEVENVIDASSSLSFVVQEEIENTYEINVSKALTNLSYLYALYEHDDKELSEMDGASLFDLGHAIIG